MRKGTPAAILITVFIVVAGCSVKDDGAPYFGTTGRHGKDVRRIYINNGQEPEYLDPGKVHDTASSKLTEHLFEGLAMYGPNAEPVPGVSERFDRSKDNRFYRFHLRADAFWSDGQAVVAEDFEYAWKRVLEPKTGSQSAPQLYMVKNAELFNQGNLKSTTREVIVRSGPDPSSPESARLPAKTTVVLLGRSPVTVDTAIPRLSEVPAGVTEVGHDKQDAKSGAPERLVLLTERDKRVVEASADGRLPKGDYVLLSRGAEVLCNGDKHHWLELAEKGEGTPRFFLPSCMVAPSKSEKSMALVAEWTALPTFWQPKEIASPPAPERPAPKPLGFMDSADLVSDPSILGVRAVGERVLEVELDYPVPYFTDVLCAATTYPVRRDLIEAFEAKGDPDGWWRPESIISNGIYSLDGWKFRYEITMKRNPYHRYKDLVKIDAITWMAVESQVSTMNLYKAGELDYVGDNSSLPPPYLPVLGKKKDFEGTPYLGTYWYEFNTKSPPLDDARVRKALDLALDKQELVDRVLRGGQIPATHFVPDFIGGGYAEYLAGLREGGTEPFHGPNRDYDPELARKLLGEAGFTVEKEGEGFRANGMPALELLYNTSEGHRAVAVAAQDMWKRNLGVSVSLRNEEWKVMLKNVRDRNFQIVRFGWIADYDHPQTFIDTFMAKSPNNRTGWGSAKFDSLIQAARSTTDTNESMRMYVEAEKILADEVPKLPIYFYTKKTLIKPYVKGFHFNRRNNQFVQWMWIDENWASNTNDDPAFPPPVFPSPGDY